MLNFTFTLTSNIGMGYVAEREWVRARAEKKEEECPRNIHKKWEFEKRRKRTGPCHKITMYPPLTLTPHNNKVHTIFSCCRFFIFLPSYNTRDGRRSGKRSLSRLWRLQCLPSPSSLKAFNARTHKQRNNPFTFSLSATAAAAALH